MPIADPIVEEIHAIRDAISKASDNDLRKIADAARSRHKASGRPSVKLPPKRRRPAKKAS
jgi:hypothetical protein